jgi:hypothetical protein
MSIPGGTPFKACFLLDKPSKVNDIVNVPARGMPLEEAAAD